MRFLIDLILRHRSICSLLLTVTLSLMMINMRPEPQAKLIRFLSMSIFYPAYATVSQVSNFTGVYSENKRLRQELVEANMLLQRARELSAENARLIGLLGFAEHYDYDLVPVRVVARDPSHQYRGVLVSGGSEQGVTEYMPLVTERGAVGRIVQVIGNMSMVQLLHDPASRVSVMVSRSRSVGILHTENGRDFFVRLRNHEDVKVEDTIVTSGLGGIFPKGLTVGVVIGVDDKSNPLFKRAYIDFAVDFDRLEELFIMRLPPQWSALRMDLDSITVGQ